MARLTPRTPHAVIDRLRAVTGLSDLKLSALLGMDAKGIYECRRDGYTPFKAIVVTVRAKALRVDLHWLFTGHRYGD